MEQIQNSQIVLIFCFQHFEKIYSQYDDDQIGALDTDEIEGFRNYNDCVLESALEEFNLLMETEKF